jgi:hypothetical protein
MKRMDSEGSRRMIAQATQAACKAAKERQLTEAERERRRTTARKLNLGKNLRPGYHGKWWKIRELALLGTMPDKNLAELLGKSVQAVRLMRKKRGIPTKWDGRKNPQD